MYESYQPFRRGIRCWNKLSVYVMQHSFKRKPSYESGNNAFINILIMKVKNLSNSYCKTNIRKSKEFKNNYHIWKNKSCNWLYIVTSCFIAIGIKTTEYVEIMNHCVSSTCRVERIGATFILLPISEKWKF